jgi:integrase
MPRQSTGSVFQRKNGLWAAQISKNGKYITKYANTQAEAELLRQQLLAEHADKPAVTEPTKPTLQTFLPQYLGAVTLKPSTSSNLKRNFQLYIYPTLGTKPLADITPLDVAAVITRLRDRGLASTSVKLSYSNLRAVLETAYQWELIPANPAAKVKPPAAATQPKSFWTL